MEQLQMRSYSRQEIAKILQVNINDNRHFKRNVTSKLDSWGYKYNYSKNVVEITEQPQSAIDKLKEIFIREYDLDIRTNAYDMACFIVMLMAYEDFQSMPWEERVKELENTYGVSVTSRTLQNWYSRLLKRNMVASTKYDKTCWVTFYLESGKVRMFVDETLEQGRKKYFDRRKELIKEYRNNAYSANRQDSENINKEAWTYALKKLWEEFHCCYYYCGSIYLNAIGDYAQEIFELVEEITAGRNINKGGLL